MKAYQTHICLVNHHPLDNILPLIDPEIAPKEVLFCTSPSLIKEAERLKDFAEKRNIKALIINLPEKHDLPSLQLAFMGININPQTSALNLSGGTKLMCLAAYEFLDDDIFRFCVERDHIYPVSQPDSFIYHDLANKIKLEDYFALYGWEVRSLSRKKTVLHDDLMDELFERVDDFDKAIGLLNKLASEADDNGCLEICHRRKFNGSQLELMSKLYASNLLSYYDGNCIHFKDEDAVDFCRGFWIEEAAYLAMKKLDLQDFAISVAIKNDQGIKNEIDAAFLHENQLYLMECKTSHLAKEGKGTQTLYKMDTLVDYTGLHTIGILASYRSLESFDLRRAQDLGIHIIQGTALKNFPKHLENIIEAHRPQPPNVD